MERTTNKSMDAMPAVWLLRKVFQPCEVGRPRRSILGDGRLSDLDPQHQQLAVDPRRFPPRVLVAHATDQGSDLSISLGSATGPPRLPVPVGSKAAALPAEHGLRLHHCDRVQDRGE